MDAFTAKDLGASLPLLLLALGTLLILAREALPARLAARLPAAGWWALAALAGAIALAAARLGGLEGVTELDPARQGRQVSFYSGLYRADAPHLMGHLVLLGAALLAGCLALPFLKGAEDRGHRGEFFALLLLMPLGGMLMVSAGDLMVAFLGLELLSLSLYVLTAIRADRPEGVEAGVKYFLLGAFMAAFFVFGLALVYAGRGSVALPDFRAQWEEPPALGSLAGLGATLILGALLFKGSLFPFQMWTPDVYQGAPTPVTALMATGTKAAAFVLLLAVAGLVPAEARPAVPVIAVATMAAGNFGALRQMDLKRLLAYSGIAHAGYLLIGVNSVMAAESWADASFPARSVYFYLVAYGLATLGAFGVIAWLERGDERHLKIDGLRGLGRRHPWAAGMLTLFLVSLGGIPPTAGFWGKLFLFSQAIRQGFHVLAALGLLLSGLSLYYYLRIVVAMYMQEVTDAGPAPAPAPLMACGVAVSALGVVLFGVVDPSLLLGLLAGVNL